MDTRKICFAASSGGHLEQLLMLEPLMQENDSFILTEKTSYEAVSSDYDVYKVTQVNREESSWLLKMVIIFFNSLFIYVKERPNVIICTGALATIPICIIGKLFGAKVIYIESFAKITSPTLTGKLLYKFADQFYVQWPSMKECYPNAIFLGGLY